MFNITAACGNVAESVVKQRQELWENERTVELDFASGRGAISTVYSVVHGLKAC